MSPELITATQPPGVNPISLTGTNTFVEVLCRKDSDTFFVHIPHWLAAFSSLVGATSRRPTPDPSSSCECNEGELKIDRSLRFQGIHRHYLQRKPCGCGTTRAAHRRQITPDVLSVLRHFGIHTRLLLSSPWVSTYTQQSLSCGSRCTVRKCQEHDGFIIWRQPHRETSNSYIIQTIPFWSQPTYRTIWSKPLLLSHFYSPQRHGRDVLVTPLSGRTNTACCSPGPSPKNLGIPVAPVWLI